MKTITYTERVDGRPMFHQIFLSDGAAKEVNLEVSRIMTESQICTPEFVNITTAEVVRRYLI